MKINLTKDEMLARWMSRRHLEPLRADCAVTRSDAADLPAICAMEMRDWYLDLLANAPADLLAPVDIARDCLIEAAPDGYSVLVSLPDTATRPLAAKLAGWHTHAPVTGPSETDGKLYATPYSAPGACAPAAVTQPDGRLRLYSRVSSRQPVLESLLAAVDTGENMYAFDERALALIPPLT